MPMRVRASGEEGGFLFFVYFFFFRGGEGGLNCDRNKVLTSFLRVEFWNWENWAAIEMD